MCEQLVYYNKSDYNVTVVKCRAVILTLSSMNGLVNSA